MSMPNGGLIQSVERALSLLTCFSEQQPEWRSIDLARRMGLTASTASRLLGTLEALGFVEREAQTGLYHLGPTNVRLAGIALNQSRLRREAIMELVTLSHTMGLGANLSVRRGAEIFYLAHEDAPAAPRVYTLLGRANPIHATGMGKALVADLPEDGVVALLREAGMPRYTANTITEPAAFLEELASVRDRGFATEREELALGRACVAAAVRDGSGHVAGALSLSGPLSTIRLDARLDELSTLALEAADRISSRLGFHADLVTPT